MIEIIDNFLKEKDFLNIKNTLTGPNFDWYYNEKILYEKEEKDHFQFTHTLYDEYSPRNSINIIKPIIDKLNPLAIKRIKCNLLTRTNKLIEHGFHTDFNVDINNLYTSVYYINTCDGYTKFSNGDKIESIENRMVIFKSNLKHTGTSCTNEKVRIIINFNFIK